MNGGVPALASETATPAAAQPNAATTDALTGGAEGGEQSQVAAPKTFTQEELDEIVKRRVSKAEDRAERRVLKTLEKLHPQQPAPQQQASQPANDGKPTRAQYATEDAFTDALTDWKLDQRDRKATQTHQQEQQRTLAEKTDRIYADAQKLPGFDRDAFDDLPLTKPIVEALVESDVSARLMHFMAANPDQVERIAKLSPARQAAEMGKLEAALPAAPKTSKTPAPIGDPTARANTTTVPTDLSKLPMDQYIAQRKKQGARWAR